MPNPPFKKYYPFVQSYRKGIALLTTLLILAILAVFMTEFSFETRLETRSIKNYQASFKARNAVKSIFKAVLEGIEKQDEIKFFREYVKGLITIGNNSTKISFLNPKSALSKIVPCCNNCVSNAMEFCVPYVSMYGRFRSSMK